MAKGLFTKLKCWLGFHQWEKWGGTKKREDGKYEQRYICKLCRKEKSVASSKEF